MEEWFYCIYSIYTMCISYKKVLQFASFSLIFPSHSYFIPCSVTSLYTSQNKPSQQMKMLPLFWSECIFWGGLGFFNVSCIRLYVNSYLFSFWSLSRISPVTYPSCHLQKLWYWYLFSVSINADFCKKPEIQHSARD